MKESTRRIYPGLALLCAVVALAAALACVNCRKGTPAIDPVPTPVPAPTTVASANCTDSSGASYPHGYRYALGAQVFECADGRFVEVR